MVSKKCCEKLPKPSDLGILMVARRIFRHNRSCTRSQYTCGSNTRNKTNFPAEVGKLANKCRRSYPTDRKVYGTDMRIVG